MGSGIRNLVIHSGFVTYVVNLEQGLTSSANKLPRLYNEDKLWYLSYILVGCCQEFLIR